MSTGSKSSFVLCGPIIFDGLIVPGVLSPVMPYAIGENKIRTTHARNPFSDELINVPPGIQPAGQFVLFNVDLLTDRFSVTVADHI